MTDVDPTAPATIYIKNGELEQFTNALRDAYSLSYNREPDREIVIVAPDGIAPGLKVLHGIPILRSRDAQTPFVGVRTTVPS